MATIVRHYDLPDAVRRVGTMPHHDYVDVFSVATYLADDRSAERWARAVVDHAAGRKGQYVWRVLLGLRLAKRTSPDHLAGWTIVHRERTGIVLEASSWFLTAQLVLCVGDGRVTVATFLRYDRPVARPYWTSLSAVHRAAMPGLLRAAVHHVDAPELLEVAT
jgi:hypothetical protein